MKNLLYIISACTFIFSSCGRDQKSEHSKNGRPENKYGARGQKSGQSHNGLPIDKYACNINSEGFCIFSGEPHKSVLSPGTSNIVNRDGIFLFAMDEAVAVNSSGVILKAIGRPAQDGDDMKKFPEKELTNDEKSFHKVMGIMFSIRNALMYDIADINQSKWDEMVTELKIRGIKETTFTNGVTPKDNYYGRQGIFVLAKNPDGRDIHHDVMKFLEESGLFLLCHVTSEDFNEMLKDTHPEGHDACDNAEIKTKIPF